MAPAFIVQALISLGPIVKNVCKFNNLYAVRINLLIPGSVKFASSKKAIRSSSSSSVAISASSCAAISMDSVFWSFKNSDTAAVYLFPVDALFSSTLHT